MVNQLIQKKNKPPIKKPEKETGYPIALSPDIVTFEKRLSEGFTLSNSEEGLKALQSLKKEKDALGQLFANRLGDDTLINTDKVKKLTDSLYLQGLSLLLKTLDTSQQLAATNTTALELENKELREELEKATTLTLKAMIEERLSRNTNSLKLVKAHRDKLDEIFCEVGLCKDSIREIRLGLPELLSHKPKDELDKTLLELRTRIEFAQRVHDEYTRQGL